MGIVKKEHGGNCLNCAHSWSQASEDEDKLICVLDMYDHKEVDEDYVCDDWN